MKVILYIRVSTLWQADNGVSLAAQLAKCRALAKLHDLTIVAVVRDAGASARSLKRPGLRRVLAMLDNGEADGVVVYALDRLTRSVRDWAFLIDRYFGERCRLLSTSESIDTRTPAGRLVLNVLMSVASWEREAASARTRSALAHKIQSGYRVGSVRYGWTETSSGKLKRNANEQRVLARMRKWRKSGWSYARIAQRLDELGDPPKNGGAKWHVGSVMSILRRA